MKKPAKKILALVLSSALLLTGCSSVDENLEVIDEYISFEETSSPEDGITSDSTEDTENTGMTEAVTAAETSVTAVQTTAEITADTEAAEAQPTAAATTAAATESKPSSSGFSASWKAGSTWQEGGKSCGTCELTVTNNSGTALKSWTVQFAVPNGFGISSSWNGKFAVSGTTVTVTNESYNGDVADGGSFSLGFNYASPSAFNPPSSITVNGSGASGGGNGNNSSQSNNQDTQPAVTEKPLPAPAAVGLVKDHGRLSVKGAQLVDKNGNNFQLKGMSTHGIAWFPDFINESSFKTLRDDWNTNAVRLAMYTHENSGYCSGGDKTYIKSLVEKGVDIATDLGMYVIIDWHVLQEQNPQTYKSEAKAFFEEMSAKYKNYDNVIYEICNEPNGSASWDNDVKPYAEEIIPIIRKNAPDAVIIVGTPTWSQDIDKALANPLSDKNVMYALHFYAATHTDWLRQRVKDCYNKGLPIFVSEFGCCDASGNGANDFGQTKQWLDLLDSCGISYMNWNLANKNESSSAFKESASANGNWKESDMNEGAIWLRKWFRGEN
ncbi:MAG: cellulase family glycosylhydrolase [Firmicutes bacterium]|nr:cellulase family glycosylhydrolase [[Eubacterium] siraeum]MCM1488232.1 cellulase family glycosylhydrolase [Bacillota bacterium]